MVKIHVFRKLFLIAVKVPFCYSQGQSGGKSGTLPPWCLPTAVLCGTCDTLSLMSSQEQLELPEVPSEPLPEKIPGMFSLHSFGLSCSCAAQGSEALSQCQCLGKWEGTAAPGVETGPAEPSLQEDPRLRSLFRWHLVIALGSSLCGPCCSCHILYLLWGNLLP